MLIVAGVFTIDLAKKEKWLDTVRKNLVTARGDAGCIEFSMSVDVLDPSRVVLFEIWETLEDLDAHTAEMQERGDSGMSDGIIDFASMRYEVSAGVPVVLPKPPAPQKSEPGWWNGQLAEA